MAKSFSTEECAGDANKFGNNMADVDRLSICSPCLC